LCLFYFNLIHCRHKNFIYFNVNHNTFYKNFIKLNKFNIFESTYKNLLIKYLSKSKNKIKQIYTDTSFYNKYNITNVIFINILKIKK